MLGIGGMLLVLAWVFVVLFFADLLLGVPPPVNAIKAAIRGLAGVSDAVIPICVACVCCA